MEKEENQNSTSSDHNQDIPKETEKPEESSGEENKQENCLLYTSDAADE